MVDAQPDKAFPSPFRFLPVVPDTISQTVPNPAVKVFEFALPERLIYPIVPLNALLIKMNYKNKWNTYNSAI